LSNGTYLQSVSPTSNPNLFFALAGAAPSYGIITLFRLQTHTAPSTMVNFVHTWYNLPASTVSSILGSFQSLAATLPAPIGISFTIGQGYIYIHGIYYGTLTEYHALMDPFWNSLKTADSISETAGGWINSLTEVANKQPLNTSTAPETRDDFFASSLMTPKNAPLTAAAISSLINYLYDTSTTTQWFVQAEVYGGTGSVITNPALLSKTSFGHRSILLDLQFYASSPNSNPPYPDPAGIDYVRGMRNSIITQMPSVFVLNTTAYDWGSYVNYPDRTFTADGSYKWLYWGAQYAKLKGLKATYDPSNVFRDPQSVGVGV